MQRRFNRYIVECKQSTRKNLAINDYDLIDTQWNVNADVVTNNNITIVDLIETQWNVNIWTNQRVKIGTLI